MSTICLVNAYYDIEHKYHPERNGANRVDIISAMFLGVEMIKVLPPRHKSQIIEQIISDHDWFDSKDRARLYAKVDADIAADSKLDSPIFGRSRHE